MHNKRLSVKLNKKSMLFYSYPVRQVFYKVLLLLDYIALH